VTNLNPPNQPVSCTPPDPAGSAGQQDFFERLAAIREDPQIALFARARAGGPELAADALQEAYCAVAGRRDYEKINDLRSYFCRVLINEIYRLRRVGAVPVGNLEEAAGAGKGNASAHPSLEPFDEALCTNLLVRSWLRRLAANRGSLAHQVPGRSPDPRRYRVLIVACAEGILVAILTKDICDADSNSALGATYPEWFAEKGCSTANLHQRFKRAKDDVRVLLKLIIDRDDLYS
jgi:hypothetical protein